MVKSDRNEEEESEVGKEITMHGMGPDSVPTNWRGTKFGDQTKLNTNLAQYLLYILVARAQYMRIWKWKYFRTSNSNQQWL